MILGPALDAVLGALALLTRLPLPARGHSSEALRRSAAAFPLVGAALGGILAVCATGLPQAIGSLPSGIVLTILLALASGGLHLDGLADFFDALGSGRGGPSRRERMLEVMRDPRIGAHGASALCLLLLLKASALALAVERFDPLHFVLLPALSRAAVVPLLCLLPAARSGLGSAARPGHPMLVCAVALVPTAAACAWAGPASWLGALAAAASAAVLGTLAMRLLGGVTGDVHGAAIETAETTAALAMGAAIGA